MIRTKTPFILLVAGALTLSACTDPAYFDNAPSKTTEGAFVGAAVGAILGLATAGDDPGKSAAIGAAAGALAGGLIGQQLDKQAAELEGELSSGDIQIVNTGSELIVIMPQGILFATDSASVNPSILGDLSALAANLNRYPDSTIEVAGHTDNTGTASYNQQLSLRRAQSVTNVLANNGVALWRLRPVGYGEDRPVASNLNPAGKAKNRRVEIIIRPNV